MKTLEAARRILVRLGLLPLPSSASLRRILLFGMLIAGALLLAVYTEAFSFALPVFTAYLIILPVVLSFLLWRERANLRMALARTPVRIMVVILAIGFLLDGLSTLVFTSMWGIESEANRVTVFLANHVGILGALVFSIMWFMPIAGIMLSRYGREKHIGKFVVFIGLAKIVVGIYNFARIYTVG